MPESGKKGLCECPHIKNIYYSGVYDMNKSFLIVFEVEICTSATTCTVHLWKKYKIVNNINEYSIHVRKDFRLQSFDLWEKVFTHKVQKRDAAGRGGGTVHMPFMLRECSLQAFFHDLSPLKENRCQRNFYFVSSQTMQWIWEKTWCCGWVWLIEG